MKKSINIILLFVAALWMSSCKTDLDHTTTTIISTPAGIAVDNDTPFVCSAENAQDTAFVITWSAADLGSNIPVFYILQIDNKNGDYSSPVEIQVGTNVLKRAVLYDELNLAMHKLGKPIETPTELWVRVLAKPYVLGSASPVLPKAISADKATLTVSSFAMAPLHLVGALYSFTHPFAWDINNYRFVMFRDDPLALDMFITNFSAGGGFGQFKAVENKDLGDWSKPHGKKSPGVLQLNGGGNIDDITTAGYHKVTINIAKLSYEIVPFDASGATEYSSMTLSGSAIATPVNFTRLIDGGEERDVHLWYAEDVILTTGTLQFEANDGTKWGGTTFPWGKYSAGNETVNVLTAGKYFVRFSDLTGHYVFLKRP